MYYTLVSLCLNLCWRNAASMVRALGILVLLIPWIRFLVEKLTVTQLVKKFPTFYGSQRFITVFTRACHWTLSF